MHWMPSFRSGRCSGSKRKSLPSALGAGGDTAGDATQGDQIGEDARCVLTERTRDGCRKPSHLYVAVLKVKRPRSFSGA